MPSYTLPLDANSRPASGGYTPAIGVITLQTGTPTTDGLGVTSAPLNVVLVPDSGTYREQSALSAGYQGAYLVPMTDVSAFKWLSLHITGDYNGTLAFQISNDGQNWDPYPMYQQSIPGVLLPSVTNLTGVFGGPVLARYFQVQMVNYLTGIATGTLEQYVVPPALPTAISPSGIKVDGSGVLQPVTGTLSVTGMATGQSTLAASVPVALAADQLPLLTNITQFNGSSVQREIVGTAQSSANALLVSSTDVSLYRAFSIQLTGTINSAVTVEQSNDNANWFGIFAAPGASGSGTYTTNIADNNVYGGIIMGRYLRARLVGSNSGVSVGCVLELYTFPFFQPDAFVNVNPWTQLPATQSGTWTVQPGNTANTTAWLTQPVVGTTGGSTPYHLITAAGTNATNVKNAAGLLYGYTISNTNASARFLKLYDSGTAPTAGSGTPKHVVQIPGSATVIHVFPQGLTFSSGIGFTTTTGIADADTGSVGTDISIDLDYK